MEGAEGNQTGSGGGQGEQPPRRRNRWLPTLVVVALLLAALGIKWHFPSATHFDIQEGLADVLANAESWELISLDVESPTAHLEGIEKGDPMPSELFHWKGVLGRTTIDDPSLRRTLTRAFNRGRGRWMEVHFLCFLPRHAISASLSSGKRVDLLICFQCESYKAYDESGERIEQGDLTQAGKAVFNRIYREQGLELAP